MKYISFVWWIAKYCDLFYFFLFVICVCLHPNINTPAVNCEERSKLSTGGYQLTGRVHGLSERSISPFHSRCGLPGTHTNEYKTHIKKNQINSITVSVENVLLGQGLKYTIN